MQKEREGSSMWDSQQDMINTEREGALNSPKSEVATGGADVGVEISKIQRMRSESEYEIYLRGRLFPP